MLAVDGNPADLGLPLLRRGGRGGPVLPKGTLLGATIVPSALRPLPCKAGAGARHPREPDTDCTRKGGRSYFGYKAPVGVDEGSGLVRRVSLTSAKVWDSEEADAPICGDEGVVYADNAYEHKGRRVRRGCSRPLRCIICVAPAC